MQKHDRQLQEIQNWCKTNGAGLDILFCGYAATLIDGVPHQWQITMGYGRARKELYHAHGTSMPNAIDCCYKRWQSGKSGYMWKEVQKRNVSIDEWFAFQTTKQC